MCRGTRVEDNLKSIPPTRWVWEIELWLLGLVAVPLPTESSCWPVHVYKNHSLTVKCPYTLEMYPLQLNSVLTVFRHHSSMWKAHNFKGTFVGIPSIMNWLLEWNCWSSRGSASRKDFRLVLKSLYQRVFQLTVLSTYILWSALCGIIVNPQPI